MTNHHYYVCPGAGKNGLSGEPHVFTDMDDAVAKVGARYGESVEGSTTATLAPEHVRISFVDTYDKAANGHNIKPRYRYYYDTHLMGNNGDGTERDPWPDLPSAISGIHNLIADGKLKPRSGETIEVSRRKVFTATTLERRKQLYELIAKCVFGTMSISLVIPVLLILGHLVYKAWPALTWDFLTLNPLNGMTEGGIWAPLVGTFFLVLVSLMVAAPIGVLAGVYLNEYARDNWFTRLINLAVVNLAGVPSIVHALFGVGAFVLAARFGESLLAASCTLAVMTLPVIITSTREALAAVPMSFRQACWNMGASRWQTIRTIVLPNSISGILTGVILQVARAAGETAPILFTGAAFYLSVADSGFAHYVPYGPWDRVMALSMHLFTLKTQVANAPEPLIYGTAVVLIGLVLAVNSVSIGFRMYLRSRKKW
ncbi:MAG: phosphate ABC transporter permease PstA [Planctomycetales bacterium]|nr:phosphate ABC transporter permease PstA [Planctomycetales bacterium]